MIPVVSAEVLNHNLHPCVRHLAKERISARHPRAVALRAQGLWHTVIRRQRMREGNEKGRKRECVRE